MLSFVFQCEWGIKIHNLQTHVIEINYNYCAHVILYLFCTKNYINQVRIQREHVDNGPNFETKLNIL